MRRGLAITVRVAAVPFWYPFAVLSWIGERSEHVFWWIERHLPKSNATGDVLSLCRKRTGRWRTWDRRARESASEGRPQ